MPRGIPRATPSNPTPRTKPDMISLSVWAIVRGLDPIWRDNDSGNGKSFVLANYTQALSRWRDSMAQEEAEVSVPGDADDDVLLLDEDDDEQLLLLANDADEVEA